LNPTVDGDGDGDGDRNGDVDRLAVAWWRMALENLKTLMLLDAERQRVVSSWPLRVAVLMARWWMTAVDAR